MGIAAGQANGEVWSQAIVHAEGKAAGIDVIAGCLGSTVDVGELAQARDKDAPPIIRRGGEDRRAAFAFRPACPGETSRN